MCKHISLALLAAFALVAHFASASLLTVGGGVMMLGARTAAWAKSGSPAPVQYGGLCLTAVGGDCLISMEKAYSGAPDDIALEYSTDGLLWTSWDLSAISVAEDESVYFRAARDGVHATSIVNPNQKRSDGYCFAVTGFFKATGNPFSIVTRDFDHDITLSDSSKTTEGVYSIGCLFYNCLGLLEADFSSCVIIELKTYPMYRFFYRCGNLNLIKLGVKQWSGMASHPVICKWVDGVSSSGTFYKPQSTPIKFGTGFIPTGWDVVDL